MTRGAVRRMFRLPVLLLAGLLAYPLGLLARSGARRFALRVWSLLAALSVGLRVRVHGPVPPRGSLLVVNHVGYLDIVALGAAAPGRFLAKAEIAGWPFLGRLARWTGTVFVDRDRPRTSHMALDLMTQSLSEGDRLVLFPEAGVSPDGTTLQPFRSMLFEPCVKSGNAVVPAAIRYTRPLDRRVWAWIDEPVLWRHLWRRVLPCERIEAEVRFGLPIHPEPGEGRKLLAARAREAVEELLDRSAA